MRTDQVFHVSHHAQFDVVFPFPDERRDIERVRLGENDARLTAVDPYLDERPRPAVGLYVIAFPGNAVHFEAFRVFHLPRVERRAERLPVPQ